MPYLRVFYPDTRNEPLELKNPPVTIGRGPGATFQIPDRGVSETHAEIRKLGEGYAISDCGSVNGTFVRNRKVAVQSGVPLRTGDWILVGRTILVFEERPNSEDGPVNAWLFVSKGSADCRQLEPRNEVWISKVPSMIPIVDFARRSGAKASLFDVISNPSGYEDELRRMAVAVLYRTYRGPLEKHVRSRWAWFRDAGRTEEVVQDFFEALMGPEASATSTETVAAKPERKPVNWQRELARYRELRGDRLQRFRSFLRRIFQSYCSHRYEWEVAAKRGGPNKPVQYDAWVDQRPTEEPEDEGADAEIETECALEDLHEGILKARARIEESGDARLAAAFETMVEPVVRGDGGDPEHDRVREELGAKGVQGLRDRALRILRKALVEICKWRERVEAGDREPAAVIEKRVCEWLQQGLRKRGPKKGAGVWAAAVERAAKERRALELLKKAGNRENGKDLPTAIQQYKKLIKAYPKSDAANEAEKRLRVLQGEEGEKDSAG